MDKTEELRLRGVKLACEEVILRYESGVPDKDYTAAEQAQRVANARRTIKEIEEKLNGKEETA